jgi:hypothetical protein
VSDPHPPAFREGPLATGFLFGLGFAIAVSIVGGLVAYLVIVFLEHVTIHAAAG